MGTRNTLTFSLVLALASFMAGEAQAQFGRETTLTSIAGTLQQGADPSDDYEFKSDGRQILVADLDADVFSTAGSSHDSGGCDCGTASTASTVDGESGCEGGETGCEGGGESGCEGGGPGRFRLEVLNGLDVLCAAGKPMRPGWDRDPRIACLLSQEGDYKLRVSLVVHGEEVFLAGSPDTHVYVLNVSLRNLPEDDFAIVEDLNDAIIRSANQLSERER